MKILCKNYTPVIASKITIYFTSELNKWKFYLHDIPQYLYARWNREMYLSIAVEIVFGGRGCHHITPIHL